MSNPLRKLRTDESGQGLAEYALLVAGVVTMVVAAMTLFAGEVTELFQRIGGVMDDVP